MKDIDMRNINEYAISGLWTAVQRGHGLEHTAENRLSLVTKERFYAMSSEAKQIVRADLDTLMLYAFRSANELCLEEANNIYTKLFCRAHPVPVAIPQIFSNKNDDYVSVLFEDLESNRIKAYYLLAGAPQVSQAYHTALINRAEQNDPSALFQLGTLARLSPEIDRNRSLLYFIRASLAGHKLAMASLARQSPESSLSKKWALKALKLEPCFLADLAMCEILEQEKPIKVDELIHYHLKLFSQNYYGNLERGIQLLVDHGYIHEACKACVTGSAAWPTLANDLTNRLTQIKTTYPNGWQAWGKWSQTEQKAAWFPPAVVKANKTWLLVHQRIKAFPIHITGLICEYTATNPGW